MTTVSSPNPRTLGSVIRSLIVLMKPRVIELLLVTTVPVMFLAERGIPSLWLILATLIGGTLSAGAANAFNMIYDRDIDAVMTRTSHRPLVTGDLSPRAAMIFAITLTVISTLWLGLLVNWLSSMLALAALLFYVFGYTMLLKRRTPSNIVWGGAAGCMPVLVGWAAVTHTVAWPAVILFFVIFFWTPPHYWPLSMRFTQDYARAGIPMAPVVQTSTQVARQIVLYSWIMVATSLVLIPVAPMGWVYTVTALLAGGVFLREAYRVLGETKSGADEAQVRPMRLFHYSITYVTLVFLAVGIDPLLYLPLPR